MKTYKMMDEVVCNCTRCKMELNHRIVRVEAGRPKRVLCLTCNTERVYRAPAPAKVGAGKARGTTPRPAAKAGAGKARGTTPRPAAEASAGKARGTTPRPAAKTKVARPSSAKARQEAEWRARINQQHTNMNPYAIDHVYRLDEILEHSLFGAGLVVSHLPPDKINVFFQDGMKTLKCGRTN